MWDLKSSIEKSSRICGSSPSQQVVKWSAASQLAKRRRQRLNSPPSPTAIERALARIKAILGSWFYAEVKARNLIQEDAEIVQFAKLTDAQMLEIGPFLKKGWTFVAASREVTDRLSPDDEIRALRTGRSNGGNWCLLSVGNFGHIVVWGAERDKTLGKIKDSLARSSVPQRS